MAENCSHSHTPPTMHSLNGDQTWERCLTRPHSAAFLFCKLVFKQVVQNAVGCLQVTETTPDMV